MPSLKSYIEKFGEIRGRKKYNAFHRQYRKDNKPRMLKYWRNYTQLSHCKIMRTVVTLPSVTSKPQKVGHLGLLNLRMPNKRKGCSNLFTR
jgi:hypothetical protein